MESKQRQERIAGLIYAGGRGLRMGGVDKAFVLHKDEPLITHMSRALGKYVDKIFITRQSDQADVAKYGDPIIDIESDQGPLAGLVAGIKAANGFDYLLTAAVDAVDLPQNYLASLQMVARPHAMASSGGDLHPTLALIDLQQADQILRAYELGERALRSWITNKNCGYVQFATGLIQNFNQY